MGCALTKPLMNSPPRSFLKLKMENGYVSKEEYKEARRSTGQRLLGTDSGRLPSRPGSRVSSAASGSSGGGRGKDSGRPSQLGSRNSSSGSGSSGGGGGRGKDSGRPSQLGSRNSSSGSGSSGGGGRVSQEGKSITRENGGGSKGGGVSGGGNVSQSNTSSKFSTEDELVGGWPKWLTDNIPSDVLAGLVPRSAESYDKIDKVGQGTYSNVYKARDRDTGKIVALKKVRFDTSEPESVKFMAREIMILQKLDHPNIVKLEGLATSRMQYSLYLVFDCMVSDLSRIITRPEESLTEPQVKCYMHQLLSGLQHCHERGILHRDIKGSNLLIDKNGMLKIADFGLANYFNPDKKRPLTSRVVTLWYRAPELLLGATQYGVGIDLWSAGCLMAEMFAGRPIMPGRTEVEQLHRIFKLCGSPSDDYWKRMKAPTNFKPPHAYKPSLRETCRDFPASSLGLLNILLDLDPAYRGSAGSALQNEFFYTNPLACDLSGLPVINKEDDEPTETNEQRKNRNSKMRRRSRTQKERRRKDTAMEKPTGDSGSSKEETQKNAEATTTSQEPNTGTTSTSSSVKPTRQEESPPSLPSPVVSSRRKMSPRTEAHPKATKNIKNLPPLPNGKTSTINYNEDNKNIYRLNGVYRSASSREFRKLDQRRHIEVHDLDD
ncbi:hypothetical protein F0562_002665 [Nyssa sinensis]|uniref:Protein kinase domain-containing protein n=1 Tax=Nyssa sinensis TaxID=561372 RepID=A0A5J5BV59_9ASTE|nr:hypothetical protein F0562_002665 [Nyssa sinensis]